MIDGEWVNTYMHILLWYGTYGLNCQYSQTTSYPYVQCRAMS